MKKIKYLFALLRLFILSPIFPIVFGFTIFVAYEIHFGVVMLCDDNGFTLCQLKTELKNEIDKFNSAVFNKEMYYTSYEELINKSRSGSIDPNAKEYLLNEINSSSNQMNESSNNIHLIEKSIKKIDPNYKHINSRFCIGRYLK